MYLICLLFDLFSILFIYIYRSLLAPRELFWEFVFDHSVFFYSFVPILMKYNIIKKSRNKIRVIFNTIFCDFFFILIQQFIYNIFLCAYVLQNSTVLCVWVTVFGRNDNGFDGRSGAHSSHTIVTCSRHCSGHKSIL